MNKTLTLNEDYEIPYAGFKIPKGAKFRVLQETQSGYKLKYLGKLKLGYSNIYYLHKHWFEKIELELIEEKYSVIGTKMPDFKNNNVKINVVKWNHTTLQSRNFTNTIFYSKGLIFKQGIKFIAFEREEFNNANLYWLITPEELAKHIPKITETKNTEDPYKSFKLHEISTILNKHLDISDVNDIIQILDNHENN